MALTKVMTDPWEYPDRNPPGIVVHALRENKRPIGFAPWPEERLPEKPKKKRKKKGKSERSQLV